MPYTYQLENRRRLRRAILACGAIGALFLLLALPERMLGWSGLGVGTPAVPELAVIELTAGKPVAARQKTPPSLDHLAFPAYAEWTELTEASCVDCDRDWSYGADSLVDAVDAAALVQLEGSSTPTERTADASYLASSLRGRARGFGGSGFGGSGVGGSGLTGGDSSLGAATKAEDGTRTQAATAPAEEVSEANTTETSEVVAEAGGVPAGSWGGSSALAVAASDPAPPPSLLSSVGSQAPRATAARPDEAWAPVEAVAINALLSAGASPFSSGPDPRNVPPAPVPEPPSPQPPTAAPEPPTAPETPTAPEPPTAPETPVPEPPVVPEPTQLILMGIALSAVVYRMRRIDR